MAITAAGVGSGIDIESILSQLNEIERQPIAVLNQKREALDVELSAYGTAKSALNTFQTAAKALGTTSDFGAFVASSSDEEVFTATASNGKTPERHEIEVLSLATNHRLASDAYASDDAAVAQGTYSFTSGGGNFDIEVDENNATLEGLRDSINSEISNKSVSASIINVDGGSRLILTAKESGTEGAITVSRSDLLVVDPNAGFSEITEAVDASLIVHGFQVTSSSNSVSNVIDGVTLNLTGTGKATVDSQRDLTSLRSSLDELVSSYNSMMQTFNQLGDSELSGDQLPRGVESQMRRAFFDSVDLGGGDFATPLELGFTFDRFGTLSIDSTKYENALENGVDRYVQAFSQADTGISSRFSNLVDEYTKAGGIIDTREDGVDSRRDTIDDQIDRLEYRVEQTNLRLRRQYTAMDLAVSNLQSTSGFLASRLSTTTQGQ
jgi:flagellar hook-associated protein 2